MSDLTISEVQVSPIKHKEGLIAFASCVINNSIYISNIAIYTSPTTPDGYRLAYPTRTLGNSKRINIFHPINRETGEVIKKAILRKYEELMSKANIS